jgi:hypothetical protein
MQRSDTRTRATVAAGAGLGGAAGIALDLLLISPGFVEHVRQIGFRFVQPLSWNIGWLDVWAEIFAAGGALVGYYVARGVLTWSRARNARNARPSSG